jgi:hypothetical protein
MPINKLPEADAATISSEQQRLDAVRRYDIDPPSDGVFDHITKLASQLLRVPIAIISIVDRDPIWFKSRYGFDVAQVDRDSGLCASCILQDEPWIVCDARADPRARQPAGRGRVRRAILSRHPVAQPRGFQPWRLVRS